MKETRILMGMPVIVNVVDLSAKKEDIDEIFNYFKYIDEKFSTYKDSSEITKINKGLIKEKDYSKDMKEIFNLAEKTKKETNGYFDIINNEKKCDPSGVVKGWAINNAAKLLLKKGFNNFYVEAGGDIQVYGNNENNIPWQVGIRNPFEPNKIVKKIFLNNCEGIATSGTYERGNHVYDPNNRHKKIEKIVAITVIGPNIYEADRFATAAFAMQEKGINFIESLKGFEGYVIGDDKTATMTSNFEKYVKSN